VKTAKAYLGYTLLSKRLRMAEKGFDMPPNILLILLVGFVFVLFIHFIAQMSNGSSSTEQYRIDGSKHTKLNGDDVKIWYAGTMPVDVEINGVSSGKDAARMIHTQVNIERANKRGFYLDK